MGAHTPPRTERRSSDPLVGDLRDWPDGTDQGTSRGQTHHDGPRSSSRRRTAYVSSGRGVYPIFDSVCEFLLSARILVLRRVDRFQGVVETRRLELLTLSLQRRCSSS